MAMDSGDSSDAHASADRSEAGPDPGAQGRSRKFVIQSTFGAPRERRSRKSRPCDACRRRKTACIITTEPPCAFCKSRGIVCQSTSTVDGTPTRSRQTDGHGEKAGQASTAGAEFEHPRLPIHRNSIGGHNARHVGFAEEPKETFGSPSTSKSSPHAGSSPSVSSTSAIGPSDFSSRRAYESSSIDFPNYGNPAGHNATEHDASVATPMEIVQPALNSPESSAPGGLVHTLEDNPGRATYYLGRTAEQDPLVLDAFSYGILSEAATVDANVVQVHRGGSDIDDLPLHFLFLSMGHPMHTNRSRQAASDFIETKVWPQADLLIRLYFKHVHPVFPIVSKGRFLQRYATNKLGIPVCLRGAVYALASIFWKEDPITRDTDPCPFEQYEIVELAHNALRREIENPNLFVLQACLLLIHVQPPDIDAMEAPTTFTYSAQATACAQLIGLHQDCTDWNIEIVEKRLRKKLWWATFLTDCWAAVSHGHPPHISETSYTTGPINIEDMRCDEDVPEDLRRFLDPTSVTFDVASGVRFLETVNITRHLRTVLDASFQVNMKAPEMTERPSPGVQLMDVHAKLAEWPSLIPSCLAVSPNRDISVSCYNSPLHLTFYAAKALLYRAMMHPATKAAKGIPDSNLNRWFPYAIADFGNFTQFFLSIGPGDLRGFWGRHARSQLILCGNFLVYLFLMASEADHIGAAHRMLEGYRAKVNKMADTAHVPTKALLRATTIRTNSFFAQAASVMRHGPEASIKEPITICPT